MSEQRTRGRSDSMWTDRSRRRRAPTIISSVSGAPHLELADFRAEARHDAPPRYAESRQGGLGKATSVRGWRGLISSSMPVASPSIQSRRRARGVAFAGSRAGEVFGLVVALEGTRGRPYWKPRFYRIAREASVLPSRSATFDRATMSIGVAVGVGVGDGVAVSTGRRRATRSTWRSSARCSRQVRQRGPPRRRSWTACACGRIMPFPILSRSPAPSIG